MNKKVELKAFGKINLGLDVLGVKETGYHNVEMVMAQVGLGDIVSVNCSYKEERNDKEPEIKVEVVGKEIGKEEDNIAYKTAKAFLDVLLEEEKNNIDRINIEIQKNIPLAAGMAGGSADGAAVIHCLNILTGGKKTLKELMKIGEKVGADIPFCIMGQIVGNEELKELHKGEAVSSFAFAYGIGTEIQPINESEWLVLICKPGFSVSTKEVYIGIDEILGLDINNEEKRNCNIPELVEMINQNKTLETLPLMCNILEKYTEKNYTEVRDIKNKINSNNNALKTMMTGSGPTVFALYKDEAKLNEDYLFMQTEGLEVFKTKTILS